MFGLCHMTAMLRSALERTGAAVASFAQVIVNVIVLVFAHPTFRVLGGTWSINQAVTDWTGNTSLARPPGGRKCVDTAHVKTAA